MVVLRLKSNVCKYLPLALLCLNLVPSWARTDGDSRSGHPSPMGAVKVLVMVTRTMSVRGLLTLRVCCPQRACGDDAIDSETGLCSEKYVFQCVPTLRSV